MLGKVIQKRLPEFKEWLVSHGASMLDTTNEWELVRFRGEEGISIVYISKPGGATFTGVARECWFAFVDKKPFRVFSATKRNPKLKNTVKRTLLKRDGNLCFYCCRTMGEDNMTVEHLVSVTHGGPNHVSNLFLAHRACNESQGHKDAVSKINQHVLARMEMGQRNSPAMQPALEPDEARPVIRRRRFVAQPRAEA